MAAKYTQKIDTRVTEFTEQQILRIAENEGRNKCEVIRLLINEALGERMFDEEGNDKN